MKKTKNVTFNYIGFFIFISISAFLTAFVYVELMKDYKNSSNFDSYKESFTIPNFGSIYRPIVRNCRLSINNNMNSLGIKLDNTLRKSGWLG